MPRASRRHALLKGGDGDYTVVARTSWRSGIALLILGSALAWLPPVAGLPVFGYAAIAALLFGAVLLVPRVTLKGLQLAPRTHRIVLDTAVAQLRENVGLSTLSLASIIVSFSLMVAMAIMVYSFRVSFDHWLGKLLPADLQLREPFGNDTAFWSQQDQRKLAAVPGVARAEFRRTRQLLLDPKRAPVTLIARGMDDAQAEAELPLVRSSSLREANSPPAWISEALQDLYGYQIGDRLALPLAGRIREFKVAGVWRDYARLSGSVVISRQAYVAATGDESANEGSLWLKPGADAAAAEKRLRLAVANGESLEIITTTALHERSLQIFDRAFAITYALEAIAVIIGLDRRELRREFDRPLPPRGVRHAATHRHAAQADHRHAGERGNSDERLRRGLRPGARYGIESGAGLRHQSPVVQLEHRSRGTRVAIGRCSASR